MKKLAVLLLAALSLPAHAAVRLAGETIQSDATRIPRSLGEQTLHPVKVDPAGLEEAARLGELVLPGIGSTPVTARFERIERRDDGLVVWVGKVDTASGPRSVVLTVGDGVAFGLIPQADGSPLKIETRDGKPWLVEGGLEPEFEGQGPDYIVPPAPKDSLEIRARQDAMAKVIPEPVVEVLVVYTPALVAVMGSDAAVQARIVQLEAISNQAYIDSQAEVRVKVVARHLVDYTVNNDNSEALTEIRAFSLLPVKAEVDRLRAQYGADLVSMIRNFDRSTQNSCGIAYLLGYHGSAFSSGYGFSVVSDRGYGGDNCGEFTFAHELGHNMGAAHDIETEEDDYGAYPYSRGHRQTLGDDGFATVMAYAVRPQVRIGTFSNPRLSTCLDQPCGIEEVSDNSRGLGQSAPVIAGFRSSIPATGPALSINDVSVTEGDAGTRVARFTVSLSQAAASPVTFDLFTSHGTAREADYAPRTAEGLSIPAGQTSLQFDVVVNGDTEVEFDEVFALNASNVSGARVADGQGVATITNDEPIPDFTIANISIGEGDSGVRAATFTATLSAPSTTPVTFDVASQAYSAASNTGTADVDFSLVTLSGLTIAPGETALQFTVPVIGDTEVEQDEAFYVIASNIAAANLVDGMATGWIRNDDGGAPLPTLSIAPAGISEGNGGTSVLNFTVTLSQPSAETVGFGASTSDITAQAGSDYVGLTAVGLSIPAGQTSATVSVTINGDTTSEPDETFRVTLNNITRAQPGTSEAIGTISNDDGGGAEPTAFAARDDRFVLPENTGPTRMAVLGNDVLVPANLAGGTFQITQAPVIGQVQVDTNGTPGTVADDALVYQAAANRSYEDSLAYRVCEQAGRCTDGLASIIVRPALDAFLASNEGQGHADITIPDLRPVGELRLDARMYAEGVSAEQVIAGDPTPENPWNDTGTHTRLHRVENRFLNTPGEPMAQETHRVVVDATAPGGGNTDLYVGVDENLNGLADPGETRCVSAMDGSIERCEFELVIPEDSERDVWVMQHNRGASPVNARSTYFALKRVDHELASLEWAATGPGLPADGEAFPVRVSWSTPAMEAGGAAMGLLALRDGNGALLGEIPVRFDRPAFAAPGAFLAYGGEAGTYEVAAGEALDRLFVDIPPGATAVTVQLQTQSPLAVRLLATQAGVGPAVAAAPGAATVLFDGTVNGNQSLAVSMPAPGRLYIEAENQGAAGAWLRAQVHGAAGTAAIARGSYFNPGRSGHGLFLYPAGNQLVGIWYTYLQDGTATWYYLQGPDPGAAKAWQAPIHRATWNGERSVLTAVGLATATVHPDGLALSYRLDGEVGSEVIAPLGSGCPTLGGAPVDASSHWFDPGRPGPGYSVQLFPNYEFYTAFVYDDRGQPRFLTAEAPNFLGADATLTLEQLAGFCPLCERSGAPSRADVGTLRRRFDAGGLVQMQVDAIFGGGVPGAWSGNDQVQPLGGPGTTQGCPAP
ncbi:reprolysin-like metallopeptidase [Arenimonas sp.]|uniref:reprolysin-like metallopeptidase n=1 Tax=Arenimonas sp. TaxID=1872635 RepID=UPI0035AF8210